jgi:AcrR family transcriptional regulator
VVAVSPAVPKTVARAAAEQALLDAAERLLADAGYRSITTRRLAAEAGVNHGLVHYYFGSNENLLVHALERFTGRLIARQRELYAAGNNPDIRARLARVNAEWRAVLAEAFEQPRRELGISLPLEALVSLVMTFNLGIMIERLGGIDTGHRELLDWIDQWISR